MIIQLETKKRRLFVKKSLFFYYLFSFDFYFLHYKLIDKNQDRYIFLLLCIEFVQQIEKFDQVCVYNDYDDNNDDI